MNKLLTTITLLCFSVGANADIYFCEVRGMSALEPSSDPIIMTRQDMFESSRNTNIVVNTDNKSIRFLEDKEETGNALSYKIGSFRNIVDWNVVLYYEWLVPKAGLEPARAKLTTPSR